ncbi:MAG TPA: signal peptidase I [Bacteroidales bacterium]|nr:signal peptidase I [Bacteroidales bacterium]HRX96299.1 signal peptidase I [Bacteroidales bacterium]
MLALIFLLPISFTIVALFAWPVFEKAGVPGWKTIVPFYNLYVWLKIIDKPMWWYIFLIIPFINVFMIMLMLVETAKCFEKHAMWEQGLAVILPFIYMPYLGLSPNEKFVPADKRVKVKKTWTREWADAIIFAVIAATIIRTFLVEAYTIPTSSMEKSLLRGDFLFVSKIAYGPKVPNTPLSFPFVHHTMPLSTDRKSFLEWIKLGYYRFPGISKIKNNDVVVFNYPEGDTVSTVFQSNASYYSLVRRFGRQAVWNNKRRFGNIIYRPVDKRENYIKRCIGTPGDTIQIINQAVYVNGELLPFPPNGQFRYYVDAPKGINERFRIEEDISDEDYNSWKNDPGQGLPLTAEVAEELSKRPSIGGVQVMVDKLENWETILFPFSENYPWSRDNYGPIYIPKKGVTVDLNLDNLPLYERLIDVYEDHDLKVKDSVIYIDGEAADKYTFAMDYYWMMGDNRHNSADSRFWGFVPEDHVVGKASFVWLSLDPEKTLFTGKIRWNKLFRVIH